MITKQMLVDAELLIDGKWKCLEGCGACCRLLFICKFLTDNNSCSIYEDRPELCKTENFNKTDFERAKDCYMLKEFLDKGGK